MDLTDTPSIESSIATCDLDQDETCGCHVIYRGKPKRLPVRSLQSFAKPHWALTLFCCVGFLQGFVISGLINVVLTTIEKRFGLSSSDAGFILSSYNIASSIVIPIVSYIGGRGIKPLWIGLGMGIMGIGCLVFASPHFLADPYQVASNFNTTEQICSTINATKSAEVNINWFKSVFIFAHVLNGIGTTALITLGMAYLDENVEQTISPLYHGIYFAIAAAFGPAAGYVLGGFTLKLFTVIGASVDITSEDASWVGAWWLGFLVSGFLLLLLCVPIMMFPRHMPGTRELRTNRSEEMHQDGLAKITEKDDNFGKKLKDLPTSILVLIRNPAFLLVSIANALDFGLISGFSAFTPKYLESMFGLTSSAAAYYLGIIVILGGAFGYICGGLVVSKAKLTVNGMIRMCCASTVVALACSFIYFYSCPNIAFAGGTVTYSDTPTTSILPSPNFDADCNAHCDCETSTYKPVCGADGVTYFSSCYAGCQELANGTYTNCSCIQGNNSVDSSFATPGMCVNPNCESLVGFLFGIFGLLFFTVLCWTPVLQWVFNRCLGGIPVPIIFGKVYDQACAVWSGEQEGQGSCHLYFNQQMSYYTLYLVLAHKVATLILYILGALLYRPSEEAKPARRKRTLSEICRDAENGACGSQTQAKSVETATISQPVKAQLQHAETSNVNSVADPRADTEKAGKSQNSENMNAHQTEQSGPSKQEEITNSVDEQCQFPETMDQEEEVETQDSSNSVVQTDSSMQAGDDVKPNKCESID